MLRAHTPECYTHMLPSVAGVSLLRSWAWALLGAGHDPVSQRIRAPLRSMSVDLF
jgi:hypothetical protein